MRVAISSAAARMLATQDARPAYAEFLLPIASNGIFGAPGE